MDATRYLERVLDSRIYEFQDPVTLKRYALKEELIETQEVPKFVESRMILANKRNTEIALEVQEPQTNPKSWWGCMPFGGTCEPCGQGSQPLPKPTEKRVHEPYISPLRFGQRERKPWTTFKDKITIGVSRQPSLLS